MKVQPHLETYTLKPTVIPPDFTLLVDTREQRHLFTRIPKGLTIQSTTLSNGDYSIRGFQDMFCVERKFAGDLYSYCSTEREKTKAKMQRFRQMVDMGGWVGLVIEDKESNIYQPQQFTEVSPERVRGAIISFAIRYHVQVYFAGTRENASRFILDHAVRFFNVQKEV
jgi:ERCC4-type nuclease